MIVEFYHSMMDFSACGRINKKEYQNFFLNCAIICKKEVVFVINNIEELINGKKYSELKNELIKLNEADIAEILEKLNEIELITIFRLLPKDLAALVFSYLSIENEFDQSSLSCIRDN